MEAILNAEGVDLSSELRQHEYLALELFEDTSFGLFTNEELAERIDGMGPLKGQVLNASSGSFMECLVVDYSYTKSVFKVQAGGTTIEVGRIYLICEFENPVLYA
jgi:hypothetical protein